MAQAGARTWFKLLHPEHVQLMKALRSIVGGSTMDQVLDLYQEARLVEVVDEEWRVWGDMNEDGTSKGPIPHCAVVAAVNFVMQRRLGPHKDLLLQTLAGLVHDAFKRSDIELRDYGQAHTRSQQRLTELFGADIAQLAELSGHAAMSEVLRRFGELEVAVAFLVDNMVVSTRIVSAAEKCDMLDAASEAGRYPYNDDGLALYGVPYFTFQRYLSAVLEAQVAFALGIRPATALAEHLRGWVTEDFGATL